MSQVSERVFEMVCTLVLLQRQVEGSSSRGTHSEMVAENIARGVKELEKKEYESSK